jgi:VWFA-related protein
MHGKCRCDFLFLFLFSSSFASTISAQQQVPVALPAPTGSEQRVPTASPDSLAGQVVFDVVVTDKSGKVITGLTQQDFTILDNGQPAKVLSMRAQSGANAEIHGTEVIVVIDELNCLFETVLLERKQVQDLLAQSGGELPFPVSLAFLTEHGIETQTHPSRDGNALIAALSQRKLPPPRVDTFEGAAADDRLRTSLDALTAFAIQEQGTPWKKMVLWISPGWPTMMNMVYSLGSKDSERVFHSVVKYSTALRRARITLYSIDPLGAAGAGTNRSSHYEQYVKGLTSPDRAELPYMALQTLAAQSGGLAVYGNNTIVNLINRCTPDLGGFYTLSIEPRRLDHVDEFHSIEIKLGTPGLKARTRNGYYAEP